MAYTALPALCLLAFSRPAWRSAALIALGVGHLGIGLLHGIRVISPFHFEILGREWSLTASAIRAALLLSLSAVCAAALRVGRH